MNAYLRLPLIVSLCGLLSAFAHVAEAADDTERAPGPRADKSASPPAAAAKPQASPRPSNAPSVSPSAAPTTAPERARTTAPPQVPGIIPQDKRDQVRWNPAWRKFDWGNLVGLGVGAVSAFGTLAVPPDETRWVTENSFDRAARNAIRFNRANDRNRARDASDIMLVMSINQVLVDTLIVTWWGHGNEEVAWQMALISTEALAINAGINGLVSAFTSRERPYRGQCVGLQNEELNDCRANKRFRSFYSGHTSTAFAMAGVTCMHHAHLPLYGGGAADGVICATSFGIAAATGLMRVASDQHWTSDIMVGAATGTMSGLLLPWLLHYRTGDLPDKPDDDDISIQVVPTGGGAMLTGTF